MNGKLAEDAGLLPRNLLSELLVVQGNVTGFSCQIIYIRLPFV